VTGNVHVVNEPFVECTALLHDGAHEQPPCSLAFCLKQTHQHSSHYTTKFDVKFNTEKSKATIKTAIVAAIALA